jgi:hypothetical protein
MKFIDIKIVFFFVIYFFARSISAVEAEPTMDSPVFGFSYNYGIFSYELLDKEILKGLKIKSDRYWIYSKAQNSQGDSYLIIAGMLALQKDTEPVSLGNEEPTLGEVIVIRNGTPKILGSADAAFDELMLPDDITGKLMQDAVNRAVKAHGCDFFREKMKDADAYLPDKLSKQVKIKLSSCR